MKNIFIYITCIIVIACLIFLCYLGYQINSKLDNLNVLDELSKIEQKLQSINASIGQIRSGLGISAWQSSF